MHTIRTPHARPMHIIRMPHAHSTHAPRTPYGRFTHAPAATVTTRARVPERPGQASAHAHTRAATNENLPPSFSGVTFPTCPGCQHISLHQVRAPSVMSTVQVCSPISVGKWIQGAGRWASPVVIFQERTRLKSKCNPRCRAEETNALYGCMSCRSAKDHLGKRHFLLHGSQLMFTCPFPLHEE